MCNLFAGISPNFALLFLFRALLGIGMGAERPAGAALAMESWPASLALTGIFGLDEAIHAFETAGARSRSMKVRLSF